MIAPVTTMAHGSALIHGGWLGGAVGFLQRLIVFSFVPCFVLPASRSLRLTLMDKDDRRRNNNGQHVRLNLANPTQLTRTQLLQFVVAG